MQHRVFLVTGISLHASVKMVAQATVLLEHEEGR